MSLQRKPSNKDIAYDLHPVFACRLREPVTEEEDGRGCWWRPTLRRCGEARNTSVVSESNTCPWAAVYCGRQRRSARFQGVRQHYASGNPDTRRTIAIPAAVGLNELAVEAPT